MKILFKFPTKSRPQKFMQTLDLYYQYLSGKNEYEFIISMNSDDPTMNNEGMKKYLSGKPNLSFYYGLWKSKIQAVNADMEKSSKDWENLTLLSDDMLPTIPEFDKVISDSAEKFYPNDTMYALHFNDGRVGQKLITLSIMGRKMYEHFGYIYHPSYTSLFCDNEFHDEVYKMGKCTYIDQVIIRHLWTTYTGRDSLNRVNESFSLKDKQVYLKRKMKNFPKSF